MTTREPAHDPRTPDEELLGAQAPIVATELSDAQRVADIDRELEEAFRALSGIASGVTIFGSARVPEHHPAYDARA